MGSRTVRSSKEQALLRAVYGRCVGGGGWAGFATRPASSTHGVTGRAGIDRLWKRSSTKAKVCGAADGSGVVTVAPGG